MPPKSTDVEQVKLSAVQGVAAFLVVVSAIAAIATWAYSNIAGQRDITSQDERLTRITDYVKREDDGIRTTAKDDKTFFISRLDRLETKIDQVSRDQAEFQREVLRRLPVRKAEAFIPGTQASGASQWFFGTM